jgi:hypothetical protein
VWSYLGPLLIAVVLVDRLAERAPDAVIAFNQYVLTGLRDIRPLAFAQLYYHNVALAFSTASPASPNLGALILAIILELPKTLVEIMFTGNLISIITALLALGIGLAAWSPEGFAKKTYGEWIVTLALAPVIGGVFIWILLEILLIANLILGETAALMLYLGSLPFGLNYVVSAIKEERTESLAEHLRYGIQTLVKKSVS